jgi:hypothetical protein
MNEAAAREVMLVRAVESADDARIAWTDADRAWASRAAAEITGADAAPPAYIARRAALAVERLRERYPSIGRVLRALTWRPWVAPALALLALALGLATDYLGPSKRVNILAFPLLALLAWNLGVYAVIVGRGLWGLVSARGRMLGPLARALGRLGHGVPRGVVVAEAPVSAALGTFAAEWARIAAPLTAARVARSLHFAAFAFAVGAIAGLYVRGLVLEYSAGWESTFLGADTVHRLLAFVLGPASALTGIPLADVPRLEALRFTAGPGENAAPWIHLYAVTVALVVLVPRLLLGFGTWLVERRLAGHFPIALDAPYFQRLTRPLGREPARVRVVPYSYQLTPAAVLGLQAIAARLFGANVEVSVAPAVAWGGEDELPEDLLPSGPLALAAVVFGLAATPESENQGAFVRAIAARLAPGTPVVAVVDESAFRRRFAEAPARLDERREAWRELLTGHGFAPVFVDLDAPGLAAAEAAVEAAIEQAREIAPEPPDQARAPSARSRG